MANYKLDISTLIAELLAYVADCDSSYPGLFKPGINFCNMLILKRLMKSLRRLLDIYPFTRGSCCDELYG